MGSIEKRLHADGKTRSWIARWRAPDGSQRKQAFARKQAAEDHLAEVEGTKRTGSYIAQNKATVRDVAESWFRGTGALKASTRHRYKGILDRELLPALGDVRVSALTHSQCQQWVSALTEKGQGASTVRQAHRVLALALGAAVKDRLLAVNPAAGVSLPRLPTEPRRHLEPDDVARVLGVAGDHVEVGVLLLTGLRMGELVGLQVGDVDHLKRRLHVRRSITEVNGRLVTTTPKTHQSREVVYQARLADQIAAACAGRGDGEPLFVSPKGHILRARNWRRDVWDRLLAEAGVSMITPHEARHTAASLAIAGGADVRTLASSLGHVNPSVTLGVYGHLMADRLDDVEAAVDALVPTSCPPAKIVDLPKRSTGV